MTDRKYPRTGAVRRLAKPHGVCVVCGEKATHTVDIQHTYMRGDDDVKRTYNAHRSADCATLMGWQ